MIKECRNVPSRLQRSGIRYHAGVIILKSIRRYLFLDSIVCVDNRLEEIFSMVTYRGRKCELSVNLGGNAGPGSRPKRTEEPGIFYSGGKQNDSLGRT